MKEILCDHCKKPITKKDDLVVTSKYVFLMLRKYHRKCFADLAKMKTLTSGFVRTRPINSAQHTVLLIGGAVIIWAIAALFLTLGTSPAILILAALFFLMPVPSLLVRAYSYLKYEKVLGD